MSEDEDKTAAPTAAVHVRSAVELLLSFELERCCAKPLFVLRALELDFIAEADVAPPDRGRDAYYYAPPAQIPASPIRAPGFHLG